MLIAVCLGSIGVAGCSSKTVVGGKGDMPIVDAPAKSGGAALERCEDRLGTVAITEADGNVQALSSAGLPRSMAPLVRHMLMKSGCFSVVDRGSGFKVLEQEQRIREEQGLDRKQQMQSVKSADFVVRAEIVFAEQTSGSTGAAGGFFGNALGGIGLGLKKKEALVVLSVMDTRTSEIITSSTGKGTSESSGLGSILFGFGALALEGGWTDTPQAKTVAAALVDAWNQTGPLLRKVEKK